MDNYLYGHGIYNSMVLKFQMTHVYVSYRFRQPNWLKARNRYPFLMDIEIGHQIGPTKLSFFCGDFDSTTRHIYIDLKYLQAVKIKFMDHNRCCVYYI